MWLRSASLSLLLCASAFGMARTSGYCTQGGQVVVTGGVQSVTKIMQSYPQCTVTIYVSGTITLASIYSDNGITPLANPFTASQTGYWGYYAADGTYDVKLSGGGIPAPFTLGAISTIDPSFEDSLVTSWNGRINAVVLESSDVAAVEQDLRPSASPSFVGISAQTATLSGPGLLTATNVVLSNTLTASGSILTGDQISQNAAVTNGGYSVINPITYNPYNSGSQCLDYFGNVVNQPLPANGLSASWTNAAVLWVSTSASMPSNGSCGAPLPVNLDYELDSNIGAFFRGGYGTDQGNYNAIETLSLDGSPGGGIAANTWVAGTLYPAGTVTACCGVLADPAYLGGHGNMGFSVGPPCTGTIATCQNPYSFGEGLGVGQFYFDQGLGCPQVYTGTTWTSFLNVSGCGGGGGGSGNPGGPTSSVQFNSSGSFGGTSVFSWNNSTGELAVCASLGGICTSTSGVDAQAFSSTAIGTAVAYTDVGANFTIQGNGTGNLQALNVGSGSPFTVSSSGVTGGKSFTSTATGGAVGYSNNGGSGSFAAIYGNGQIAGEWLALADQGSPPTPMTGDAFLYPTSTGLFLSLNGGAYNQIGTISSIYCSGSGTNTIICPGVPPPGSYTDGLQVNLLVANNNTGATTLNVNGLGAISVLSGGSPLGASALVAGNFYTIIYSTTGPAFNLEGITGGCPMGSNTQVQYNNAGACGASANFIYNNSSGQLIIGSSGSLPGMIAPIFTSSSTGASVGYSNNGGSGAFAGIYGNGQIAGQWLALADQGSPPTPMSGDAFLYASTAGLFLSLNGGSYNQVGGTPGGANANVQVNVSGVFGAYSNFTYSGTTLTAPLYATSGATGSFTSTATGSNVGYSNNGSAGTFAAIYGNGQIAGQWLALREQGSAVTGTSSNTFLSSTSTQLFASFNGGAPVAIATVAGSNTQVQYNNSGGFGASANFTYNNGTGVLAIGSSGSGPGIISPVFNCTATGSSDCVQQQSGTFTITGAGNAAFQGLSVTSASTLTGGVATGSASNSTLYVGSGGNFYNRTTGGSTGISCSGITSGWMAVTSDDYVVVCIGSARFRAALVSY